MLHEWGHTACRCRQCSVKKARWQGLDGSAPQELGDEGLRQALLIVGVAAVRLASDCGGIRSGQLPV